MHMLKKYYEHLGFFLEWSWNYFVDLSNLNEKHVQVSKIFHWNIYVLIFNLNLSKSYSNKNMTLLIIRNSFGKIVKIIEN
jgi:hypothetical protein